MNGKCFFISNIIIFDIRSISMDWEMRSGWGKGKFTREMNFNVCRRRVFSHDDHNWVKSLWNRSIIGSWLPDLHTQQQKPYSRIYILVNVKNFTFYSILPPVPEYSSKNTSFLHWHYHTHCEFNECLFLTSLRIHSWVQ